MRVLIIISFIIPSAFPAANNYVKTCNPSDCWQEGGCYCDSKFDGWSEGGVGRPHEFINGGLRCERDSTQCKCPDCGNSWILPDTQCKDWRCDDDTGQTTEGRNCMEIIDPSSKVLQPQTKYHEKFFCYNEKKFCKDLKICPRGQYRDGCKRASQGKCKPCAPAQKDGVTIYTNQGTCELGPCSIAGKGQWVRKACTALVDADIAPCEEHAGNPQGIALPIPQQYYCPGNGLALPVPDNAMPTNDYSSFVCKPGFYALNSVCLQCDPGSYCVNGIMTECPENYYSKHSAQSSCDLCTLSCDYSTELPILCPQGSTYDPKCIACGFCSFFSSNGHKCLQQQPKNLAAKYPS